MPEPLTVDRLEVLVLVDNVTDSLSTTPKHVIPEWSGLLAAGRLPAMAGPRRAAGPAPGPAAAIPVPGERAWVQRLRVAPSPMVFRQSRS